MGLFQGHRRPFPVLHCRLAILTLPGDRLLLLESLPGPLLLLIHPRTLGLRFRLARRFLRGLPYPRRAGLRMFSHNLPSPPNIMPRLSLPTLLKSYLTLRSILLSCIQDQRTNQHLPLTRRTPLKNMDHPRPSPIGPGPP